MSEEAAKRATDSAGIFFATYSKLASQAIAARRCLFKFRPKWHYFAHQVMRLGQDRHNPRFTQCLHDESMLGKFKAVARVCHRARVPQRALQRVMLDLAMRWR